MALIRLLILTMAIMAGISVDSYAGCGASKPLGRSMVRSKSVDQTSAQLAVKNRGAMPRTVSCVVESLRFYYMVKRDGLRDFTECAANRLAQSGATIVRYQLAGQTIDALMASGFRHDEAAELVWQARRASTGEVNGQEQASELSKDA